MKLFIECFIWHIAWVLVVSYGLDLCCWLLNCYLVGWVFGFLMQYLVIAC
ncbi:hypothetical protein IO403_001261 [Campylobacter lari]|nr:hypothetical protein [Campylobacter lari]